MFCMKNKVPRTRLAPKHAHRHPRATQRQASRPRPAPRLRWRRPAPHQKGPRPAQWRRPLAQCNRHRTAKRRPERTPPTHPTACQPRCQHTRPRAACPPERIQLRHAARHWPRPQAQRPGLQLARRRPEKDHWVGREGTQTKRPEHSPETNSGCTSQVHRKNRGRGCSCDCCPCSCTVRAHGEPARGQRHQEEQEPHPQTRAWAGRHPPSSRHASITARREPWRRDARGREPSLRHGGERLPEPST